MRKPHTLTVNKKSAHKPLNLTIEERLRTKLSLDNDPSLRAAWFSDGYTQKKKKKNAPHKVFW